MVMHARKIPRLEDGYFERSQSHSYDNAVKYNSKGLELYNNKLLHKSPSGSSGRNESPSSRPSPHFSHKSYVQRMRDKDRRDSVSSSKSPLNKERTKLNASSNPNFNSRENSFSSSSKTSENSRTNNSYRTSNHEQNKIEEKRLQVGDWSEHISSSGKKYYYNCRTEVSQWEKPKEWLDWERHHGTPKSSDQNKAKFHNYDHHHSSSLKERHSSSSSDGNRSLHSSRRPSAVAALEEAKRLQANGTNDSNGDDMDISPDPSSRAQLPSPSQVSLSDLPKVISQLAGAKALPNFNNLSPQEAIKTIQQALQLTKQVTTLAQSGALKSLPPTTTTSSSGGTPAPEPKLPQQQVKVESPQRKEASPEAKTPIPCNNSRLVEADRVSPTSDTISSSRPTSPITTTSAVTGGGGSLGGLSCQPGLSPSLAQYYREELTCHVAGWPSDPAERQAGRLAEEALALANMVTRVSTELKMARSQVRVAEIQATFQEQRIIFLRQQIRFTEDLRTQKFNEPTS